MTDKKILIVTCSDGEWGGSEELWARMLPYLINYGYSIAVCKEKINFEHIEFKKLKSIGVELHELNPLLLQPSSSHSEDTLAGLLDSEKFSLAIISQGINFDGLGLAYACLLRNIPYSLISQKAVDSFWPYHVDRIGMRNVYINAEKAFFVSKHNLTLTEEQFGIRLRNAQVVSNPIKIERKPQNFPNTNQGYRLACIGRFLLIDKGQDILIRIMAQEKWKARPLKVSFFGQGQDKAALIDLAGLLGANNVEFLDPQYDIEKLWENYHALVLPSRFEGMPLVLLEAMALGKTAIVSDAGGSAELITDGKTGFIGQPNNIDFEQALERAWQAREEWPTIGLTGFEKLKSTVPEFPERDLADEIDKIINQDSQLVSVIIPTYNRAHIVEDAIISVLNQTYPHVQLIVADDGSTDETDAIMAKYPQITYIKLHKNGGQAKARNEGYTYARGHYVATLDSDDTWEPNFLETCVNLIKQHDLDFVFTNWMQDMKNGEFIDRFSICKVLENHLDATTENTIILDDKELRKIYLSGCPSPSSSLLFKKSSLRSNWSSGLKIADDWCLLMDIIYTKPRKAAFTRDILWRKKVDGFNIYDGRELYDLMKDLWTHDLNFLYERFRKYLTTAEKKEMRSHLSDNYLKYAYFQIWHKKQYLKGIRSGYSAILFNKTGIIKVIAYEVSFKAKKVIKHLFRLK
jgi:glycosyltransferase involved in cell wall biosynthesis